ncbi:MAG: hypothetical protein LBI62_00315, partial [Candidatus Accumulibacter sp.]|nr:hypothetical protein [Accumulibacter sp.]
MANTTMAAAKRGFHDLRRAEAGWTGIHRPTRGRSFAACRFVLALAAFTAVSTVSDAGVLKDQNGRDVRCPERVERLVTLTIPGAAMAVALDQGPGRLIGIHPS